MGSCTTRTTAPVSPRRDSALALPRLASYHEKLIRTLAESLAELDALRTKFDLHVQNFRDWSAAGGPINPIWARETSTLRKLLHRAQCRAVARIFALEQESQPRCVGAYLLYRRQRVWANQPCGSAAGDAEEYKRRHLEELATCNSTGKFERFGDSDVAFVCDFCDGYLVWPDLEAMPSIRAADEALAGSANPIPPPPAGAGVEHWQATGFALSTREEKTVVFAPLAVGNHLAPEPGDWRARLVCPFCDDEYVPSQGDGPIEATRYTDEERVLGDLSAFQEHLEWYHTPLPKPTFPSSRGSCTAM